MENHESPLDAVFHALADPTRRAVVDRLALGPAPVKELAEPFAMGLPSFLKHLKVLESDGLIRSEKIGRVRTCRIDAARLAEAEAWLAERRRAWQASADRLAAYVETRLAGSCGAGNGGERNGGERNGGERNGGERNGGERNGGTGNDGERNGTGNGGDDR